VLFLLSIGLLRGVREAVHRDAPTGARPALPDAARRRPSPPG
jgi:hypothetical protein